MPCKPEIRRRYATRHEAWEYLASRGFACGPLSAWENGRWAATVVHDEAGFNVTVWLRAQVLVSQAA
jgi:hypothetical protein